MDEQTGYTIPEDLAAIEDLAAAEQAALDAAAALAELDDPTDEQLEQLERIADHVEALRVEGQTRETAAAERTARRDAAAARLAGPADEGDGGDGADEGEEGADAGDGSEGDSGDGDGEVQAQAVAAGGGRTKAPSLVRRTKAPANPMPKQQASAVTITASAGIPDVEAGSQLDDMLAVAKAFAARTKSFPNGRAPDQYIRNSVASFSRGDFGGLTQDNRADYRDDQELLVAAGNPDRLDGGLVAAGWCSPSQTLYDLLSLSSTDGIIDLPEVGITRGGIRFTTGPDFSTIYSSTGFAQTEAQAIAGDTKDCYEVECPDFEEVRLDAVGLCIKAGILTNTGYPELVQQTISEAMVAHQHKVAARMITAMSTALGAAVTPQETGSVAWSTLTALELIAEAKRYQYRMAMNATLEVILPDWLKVALRADLQNRNGQVAPVTDAQLDEHFTTRRMRVQWVYNYQDLTAACPIVFPATVTAMMYPAGTFVKGTEDVISLDTVYDTTDLQSNVYTALFFEEGVLLAHRAFSGCKVTVPVAVTGRSGAADITVNYGTDPTP